MTDGPVLGRRYWRGLAAGPLVRLAPRSALLVVGPTQSGKTSSLVIPALLRWADAAVVTSVKRDVVEATIAARRELGTVSVLEPGADAGLTWDPLEDVATLRRATRAASDLVRVDGGAESAFWNQLATTLVGALFARAHERGTDVFEVADVVARRRLLDWSGASTSPAAAVIENFLAYEPRTLDSVLATADALLAPWRFAQPLARVGPVVTGANTLYLVGARGEQRAYEPLFRGALRTVLEHQQSAYDRSRARRLLLVLDEAATIGALDELDQLAATLSGLRVTLVSVVQDFAQLRARWGERAATIVNNHATRLVLAGLSDPSATTYLPDLDGGTPERPAPSLRERPRGTATVVAGRQRAFQVRLVPWWRQRCARRDAGGRSLRLAHDLLADAGDPGD